MTVSLFLIVSVKSNGDTSTYPQSATFGNLINPNIDPLRPTGEFVEIQELVNTANYINIQRANAEAAVVAIQGMIPSGIGDASTAIVAPAGYTDSFKIDLTESAGYYNQSIVSTVNADYYTGKHLLEDTYTEAKGELEAQIALFTAAATEISKVEAMYEQALMSETEDQRVAIQQMIRAMMCN